MMDMEPKRGRPTRAETLVRERRRRVDNTGQPKKLAVLGELDNDAFEYRWINDQEARLQQKTQGDDWAICTQDGGELKPDAVERDGSIRALVGAKKDGSPLYAYLCRKPKELAALDRKAKDRRLDDLEAQIRNRGPVTANVDGREFYNPEGGRNTVDRR
jgi:hypothetical protein